MTYGQKKTIKNGLLLPTQNMQFSFNILFSSVIEETFQTHQETFATHSSSAKKTYIQAPDVGFATSPGLFFTAESPSIFRESN